jgi:Flp pilus assembly protein TadD
MTMKKIFTLCLLLSIAASAMSADTTPAEPSSPSWQSQVKKLIEAKNYDQAITTLRQSDANPTADWHNLMGYSLRQKTPPNLAEAEKNYLAALGKDAKHRGALEYYGELLLLKNDLAGAETMLARLDKACTFGCEEYRDLKKSILQFKSRK